MPSYFSDPIPAGCFLLLPFCNCTACLSLSLLCWLVPPATSFLSALWLRCILLPACYSNFSLPPSAAANLMPACCLSAAAAFCCPAAPCMLHNSGFAVVCLPLPAAFPTGCLVLAYYPVAAAFCFPPVACLSVCLLQPACSATAAFLLYAWRFPAAPCCLQGDFFLSACCSRPALGLLLSCFVLSAFLLLLAAYRTTSSCLPAAAGLLWDCCFPALCCSLVPTGWILPECQVFDLLPACFYSPAACLSACCMPAGSVTAEFLSYAWRFPAASCCLFANLFSLIA